MKYGLTDKNIEDLKGVLSAYQPIEKAIVCALPETKTCIALMGDAITPDDLKEIINAVDTLHLSISVLLFSQIADDKVRGLIEQDGLVLFEIDCEEEEWKEYKLGEICDISSSKRIFYSEYTESGIPFYRSKEIIDLYNKRNISSELFISNERYNEIKSKFGVPTEDDILLTSVGSIGIPYKVKKMMSFILKMGI